MDPISIQNQIRSLQGLTPLTGPPEIPLLTPEIKPAVGGDGKSFGEILAESIGEVNAMQLETDKAMEKLASGETGNIHETLIAVQKAELSMRVLLEVRSKLLAAYHEVMRMQV